VDPEIVHYLLGAGGAAGLALLLILIGQLVPQRYHKKALEENERLQGVNDSLVKANEQLREANTQLASSGQLTNQVLTVLVSLAQGRQAALPGTDGADIPGHPGKMS